MAIQHTYQEILLALSKAKVRFLIAGGIAMNIHGLERATHDLDLIVFLDRDNVLKFIKVMKRLGYEPKIPVKAEDFAVESLRQKWIKEKGMVVFSFFHPKNVFEVIDVFVYHPRPFEQMFKARKVANLLGQKIAAVGLEDMLYLKRLANRPKDELDLRYLENVLRKKRE
ncbi:MAG: hypothetical protein HYY44_08790 [Deltaproteobacteria bacterium]|nr:hypothetical protein [Deltaproteobacteria bacterium]MBI4373648.1 hypothetical protein [Deltaproteobacteria bacterium]